MAWSGEKGVQTTREIKGHIRQPDGKTGALLVTLDVFGGWWPVTANYNIIDTDYSSYSVSHTCRLKYGFLKKEQVYILSK